VSPRRVLLLLVAFGLTACAASRPLYVIEEHDEMIVALLAAREEGHLTGPATLIHVDAHEDFGLPELDESLPGPADESAADQRRRLERLVRSGLAVDDVIVPAVMLGLVDEVVWAVPRWLGEASRETGVEIGSRGGRGRIFARGERLDEIVYPDRVGLRMVVRPLDDLPHIEGPWVLGIDLDAFECRNPHRDHVDRDATEEEARRLLDSGEIVARGETEEEDDVRTVSMLVSIPGEPWLRRVDRVEDAGAVRYVIGWPCLGESRDTLPHHEAAPGEWDRRLRGLVASLARNPEPPALIVICRSAGTGFVPADRVEALQTAVLRALDTFVRTRRTGYPDRGQEETLVREPKS